MKNLYFYKMSKVNFLCVISCAVLFIVQISASRHDCVADNDNFLCKLGSKSPYRFVANYDDSLPFYAGCQAQKAWMIVRHGTRYPSKKDIKSMKDELPVLRRNLIEKIQSNNSKLSEDLICQLNGWKIDFDIHHSKNLDPEGENEMTDLADRMQTRFPFIFPDSYNNQMYKFKFTQTQRTQASAKYFALGLFGQQGSKDVEFLTPEKKDPILRFYKKCQAWISKVKKNPDSYRERDLFIKSPMFQKVIDNLSKRVGFKIDYDKAFVIYTTCAFDVARNKENSPWCELFHYNDFKVFEFAEDLKYYSTNGYQNDLNYQQACPLLLDMFNFLESDNKTLASVYFTHSGAVLKALSLLGIGKDKNHITHQTFFNEDDSRKWRTSLLDTFGSNVAFILYDCKTQGKSLLIMHQERPVHIPGCPPHMPCPIPILKKLYPDNVSECNFNKMCSMT